MEPIITPIKLTQTFQNPCNPKPIIRAGCCLDRDGVLAGFWRRQPPTLRARGVRIQGLGIVLGGSRRVTIDVSTCSPSCGTDNPAECPEPFSRIAILGLRLRAGAEAVLRIA